MSESNYELHVLADGYSRLDKEGWMLANCSCTLIKGPKNVIVDTMTPWDGEVIKEGLAKHGLTPVFETFLARNSDILKTLFNSTQISLF
jgi:hypothetical protein